MSLPSGYTQLEYIQSSGTQRINTNYNPTQNTRVLAKAYFNAISSSTTRYFFGAATSSKNAAYECGSSNSKIGIVHNAAESKFTFPSTNPFTIDYNKNVIYFNGSQVGTFDASTFTSSHTLYIFDTNRNNAAYRPIPAITLYSFKIYTNDVLQRDYVPCRNQSNEIGLYDVVNNIFYGNAGTGSFVAGAEVKGSHKTMIDGTWYDLKAGGCLVGGTAYSVKKGRTLVNGTGYDISFGITLNTITPGAILYLNESGSPVPFYIAKHDYESGLNGAGRTLLVRKDCYDKRSFSDRINAYAKSLLDSWLCKTYLKLLDADIQAAIGKTKFYYTPGQGNNTVTTLQRAVFQLSLTELGKTEYYANTEGSALPIANTLQIAYLNGSASPQWTRTPYVYDQVIACSISSKGNAGHSTCGQWLGSRPAFTLPATTAVTANPDGTYTLAT